MDLPELTWEGYVTPYGIGLLARADDLPLCLELPAAGRRPIPSPAGASAWRSRLERYFAGQPVDFELDLGAFAAAWRLTPFQTAVYAALARLPYGVAVSYRDLATAAGRPRAWRAVGTALAANPLPIILPCHRVVRNDGRLGEYGGRPEWKARLLRLEGLTVGDGRLS
ncbi:MAG TPA: methylated-DNA--[protein]-cysteine S-methyltransferase [Thermoleophilia bacterium]|nr:methylated-DNA--[protein]-cysteine S-methyltransferase [Thermoleophilia bacterium]HQG03479.1 methylated-DNA--[protein]-cysteine S-methyltransferase [Thermoleophilia bacterium]HQG54097.1 methylated-DNA--[protein]-cysteine S-methyltransferase [Thermoleophilia bacterium]HQJ97521.1 methylated-DNA--[protein]-cysteine S-methyltransferase [Thermoleophilia bacterium]